MECVLAKIWQLLPLTPSAATSVDVRPVLTSVQLSPLSVERYTPVPHPSVPAKIVPTGLIARDQMLPQSKPVFTGVQLSPLSIGRKPRPPKYVPCKNAATRIDRQRANKSPKPVHWSPLVHCRFRPRFLRCPQSEKRHLPASLQTHGHSSLSLMRCVAALQTTRLRPKILTGGWKAVCNQVGLSEVRA